MHFVLRFFQTFFLTVTKNPTKSKIYFSHGQKKSLEEAQDKMHVGAILLVLILQQFAVSGAIKTSVSNTTVGSTQYIVKKTMFRKYPSMTPTSAANNYQSIQEMTNATTT